ncbi:MAG: hypothetical protein CVU56_08120 [Deltaproteobacteria bacterium HGW-Deltaproteobacteria-14]|nr:MAG: hypothetical protein CVU56_08120 [Deltaproteobacteria bacterium HGW-Deltaproteobacteria-14]
MSGPTRLLLPLALLLVLALPGCADDPVAHSETVSIELSGIKPGDLKNGVASEEKNINTESGNPYAEFLKNARAALGGEDPGAIELVSAYMRVNSTSKNVIAFEGVLVDAELFIANSQTTIPVGSVTSPKGSSVRITLDPEVDFEPLRAAMLGGDFKVGVRGNAVAATPADFDLKISLDLKFTAYE